MLLFTVLGTLSTSFEVKEDAEKGDFENASKKIADFTEKQAESEAKNAILKPVIIILVTLVTSILALIGIKS